jgi:hypothetical protein
MDKRCNLNILFKLKAFKQSSERSCPALTRVYFNIKKVQPAFFPYACAVAQKVQHQV